MTDPFFDELRSTWLAQHVEIDAALVGIKRARWRPWLTFGLEILGSFTALLIGAYFFWQAFESESQRVLYLLSAAALLIIIPSAAAVQWASHRQSLFWRDETPEALLRTGLKRAEATVRLTRMNRWSCLMIGLVVAVLWLAQLLGLVQAQVFLIFYTWCCAAACSGSLMWSSWAARRAYRDRDTYGKILAELEP